MSLPTGVTKLEELRAKLFAKAKAEAEFRFYTLYDKIHRSDVLAEALRISKENRVPLESMGRASRRSRSTARSAGSRNCSESCRRGPIGPSRYGGC